MTGAASQTRASGPLPAPEAIVFDCYDTLFQNPQSGWQAVIGEIAVDQNLDVDAGDLYREWKALEVRFRARRVNMADPKLVPPFMSYEQAWAQCFDEAFRSMGLDGDPAMASRRCVEHMAVRPPFPETATTLESLDGRCAMGVFSNADDDFLLPLVVTTGVEWAAVATSESARVYKPMTAAFDHISGLLNVNPGDIWYVGDHLFDDVLGSNKAGMTSIWVNRDAKEFDGESRPDAVIDNLGGVLTLLDEVVVASEARRAGDGQVR